GTLAISQRDLDAGSFAWPGSGTCTEDHAPDAPDTVMADQRAGHHLAQPSFPYPTLFRSVGQIVTYTLTATNNGNVTLHNVNVTEYPTPTRLNSTQAAPASGVAPVASIMRSRTHAITQADLHAR